MRFQPYLGFNGNCREAFETYRSIFGGELEVMTMGDSPVAAEVPPDRHDSVMHACLTVGDSLLMASDMPSAEYAPPTGTWVSVHLTDPADAERIFGQLAEGGAVAMPIGKTFWAERFGMVTDRFGTPWMINCEPAPSPVA